MNLPAPNIDHSPAQAEALLNRLVAEHQHGVISDAAIRSMLPRLRWRDATGARYTLGVRSRTWYAWDGVRWVPASPSPTLHLDLDPEPEPAVDPMSPLQESPPQWARTHVVPDGGLQAWSSPDPSVPAAATLAAGVELQLREQRGDWANVVGSNGWSGWVDARRLVARP